MTVIVIVVSGDARNEDSSAVNGTSFLIFQVYQLHILKVQGWAGAGKGAE